MKKLILAAIISIIFSAGVQAEDSIDLNQCSSYYDGCNTCSVVNGKLDACTEMACFSKGISKCLVPIVDTINSAQELCEQNKGIYDISMDTCTINNNNISGSSLYGAYTEVTVDMMYMGGSKYFSEQTGTYNVALQQADYEGLFFIKINIPSIYKLYAEEINTKISSLENALGHNIDTGPENKYEEVLGKETLLRVDILINKLVATVSHMTDQERDQFLQGKVQLLETLKTKYVNKNASGKYDTIIILVEYLTKEIEKHIGNELNIY